VDDNEEEMEEEMEQEDLKSYLKTKGYWYGKGTSRTAPIIHDQENFMDLNASSSNQRPCFNEFFKRVWQDYAIHCKTLGMQAVMMKKRRESRRAILAWIRKYPKEAMRNRLPPTLVEQGSNPYGSSQRAGVPVSALADTAKRKTGNRAATAATISTA
jgi:hypothetical protein